MASRSVRRPSWLFRYCDVAVLLLLYLLTFVVVLPALCWDWYYSWYFVGDPSSTPMATRALNRNDQRLYTANQYLEQLDPHTKHDHIARTPVDIAIGIVSIKRPLEVKTGYQLGYLTQVAANFHRLVSTDTWFGRKELFICNVDASPSDHAEATGLSQYIQMVTKYGKNVTEVYDDDPRQVIFEKEKRDYTYCLEKALDYKPKFVLLVEDDAIPKDDIFPVLYQSLLHINHPGAVKDDDRPADDWGYLKLFYPPKWQGYANEPARIAELVGIALLGGSIFVVALVNINARCLHSTRFMLKRYMYILYFTFGMAYACLVALSVGRQYVIELLTVTRYGYRTIPAPGCCTQAVVYPVDIVPDIVTHLNSVYSDIDFSVDLIIDHFVTERRLKTFLVEPNVMNHVGMISTMRHYDKYAAEFIF